MITSFDIIKLGTKISQELKSLRIDKECVMSISIGNDNLHKLDEDFYYRNFPDGKDYVPTDGELDIKFDNLKITIKE